MKKTTEWNKFIKVFEIHQSEIKLERIVNKWMVKAKKKKVREVHKREINI